MTSFAQRLGLIFLLTALAFFEGYSQTSPDSVTEKREKIFMTGDSHVFAKIYPNRIEELLKSEHPNIDFAYWAKNGICFYSFNNNPEYFDTIFNFRPELLIVHLGTNGAYDNNFTRPEFRNEMEKFYSTLTDTLPEVRVVFVTPFTNKKRKQRHKGRWRVNNKNREVADEIIAFVDCHPNTFVLDNNAEAGMKYLKSPSLIRPDNVHLTEAGYLDLANQVGKDILSISELWTSEEPAVAPKN